MAKKRERREVIITPREDFAYGHIIKALAGGLYPNKFHVVREYIQNSFDAIANWKKGGRGRTGKVRISIQKPSIFVLDDGTGMDRHTLNEYRKVGFSKKMMGESAGFRGIGKLAGISVAKRLIITTSPYGVSEKYTLTFNAEDMIKEVDELKKKRENIPLNSLIAKQTKLTSDFEKKNAHYTMVELSEIRKDSKLLFRGTSLATYISHNAPVPFDPSFHYGKAIEDDIATFVEDYDCVPVSVDGVDIFKPYASNLRSHKHIIVWDKQRERMHAFCWYCENQGKGQIKPANVCGLTYRYKNFTVGDNYLTRKTIWETSPHLAFYFIGEVYIIDPRIVPTSQRDDFEQSEARDSFYKEEKVIASELNSRARANSGIRRAEEYVQRGAETVSTIQKELKAKEPYLRDLSVEKIAQLHNVVTNIKKRQKNIPVEDKKMISMAGRTVKRANKLLTDVRSIAQAEAKEFDIVKRLRLNKQAADVYFTTVRTLKDIFVDDPDELERIIKALHVNLIKTFPRK